MCCSPAHEAIIVCQRTTSKQPMEMVATVHRPMQLPQPLVEASLKAMVVPSLVPAPRSP